MNISHYSTGTRWAGTDPDLLSIATGGSARPEVPSAADRSGCARSRAVSRFPFSAGTLEVCHVPASPTDKAVARRTRQRSSAGQSRIERRGVAR